MQCSGKSSRCLPRTISLVVIMLELTGGSCFIPWFCLDPCGAAGLDYVVPFMISVLLAKAVGDSLNEGPGLCSCGRIKGLRTVV